MRPFQNVVLVATLLASIAIAPTAEAIPLGPLVRLIVKLSDRVVLEGVQVPMTQVSSRRLGEQILDNRPTLDPEWVIEELSRENRFSRDDINKLLQHLQGEAPAYPSVEDRQLFHNMLNELVAAKKRTYRIGLLCDIECQISFPMQRTDGSGNRWELRHPATQDGVDEVQAALSRFCRDEASVQMCVGTKPDGYQVTMSCAEMAISFSLAGDTSLKIGNRLVSIPAK